MRVGKQHKERPDQCTILIPCSLRDAIDTNTNTNTTPRVQIQIQIQIQLQATRIHNSCSPCVTQIRMAIYRKLKELPDIHWWQNAKIYKERRKMIFESVLFPEIFGFYPEFLGFFLTFFCISSFLKMFGFLPDKGATTQPAVAERSGPYPKGRIPNIRYLFTIHQVLSRFPRF